MPQEKTAPVEKTIQQDVVRVFSMKTHRLFHRQNGQVYAIVGVNPDLHVLSDIWFGQFDSQREFRNVLSYILELLQTGPYRFWLADLRFMAANFAESEDWLVKDLMPAALDAGLKREAVVLPTGALRREGEDAFATASNALQTIADGRVRGFTDMILAKQWLLEGALP